MDRLQIHYTDSLMLGASQLPTRCQQAGFTRNFEGLASKTFEAPTAVTQSEAERSKVPKRNPK